MYITSINSYQNSNHKVNFGAIKLGKLNKNVTQETRNLADKAVDLYENVANKHLNVNGITIHNSSLNNDGLIHMPLKLSKEIGNDKVELYISSEYPRHAHIQMSIKHLLNDPIVYTYNSSRYKNRNEGHIERFIAYKKPNTYGFKREVCTPNETESNIFNKYLKEFLDSADKIKELFK